jgi:hypothetical protein
MSGEIRQCSYCGRVGVRGFTPQGICVANRACRARRDGQDGFLVRRIAKRAAKKAAA